MPIIVIALIVINVIVFVIPYLIRFGPTTAQSILTFQQLGWKSNVAIRDGEYYRLVTSAFLHGDILHLFFNMYSLWAIGPSILPLFGSTGFALIYFGSAIGGSLASFILNPSPSLGASGAVFGLIGAYVVVALVSRNPSLLANIGFIIALNLVIGFLPGSNIDNSGHIGGLVAGIGITLILVILQSQTGLRLR